jgi:hypothetical protein
MVKEIVIKRDTPPQAEVEENKEEEGQFTLNAEVDNDGDEIKFESFELMAKIGKGNFGEVFKVVFKKEKERSEEAKEYAMKAMK